MKKTLSLLATVLAVSLSSSVYANQNHQIDKIYTVYGGSQNGITVRNADTLSQINFFDPGFYSSSIVSGNDHNMYLTSGNTIYNYSDTGSFISSFDFPDSAINYHQIAYAGDKIYTAYDGSQNGVTVRDSMSFNQESYFDPGFEINGITAGDNNDMYLTSGNKIYNYSDTGALLGSFTWPSTSITYSDTTFNGEGEIYTVYDGSQKGVTVRDADTFAQSNAIALGFSPSGIASGDNNDMYLTFDNVIYQYADSGALLNQMTFPDFGIEYGGITFASAVPEPSAIALMLGGLGLVGFMAARRRKALR
ncbi:hypothetical protein MNBD_GAMMA04-1641 [hydrothermal vent metagenome]|uniref:Ice-binding protein C-terminal domain-containing protein n=1 Tax=hydrothermal vent metagenome TaxID=652676 RepID=A0A3B0VYU6_9ZZZZ